MAVWDFLIPFQNGFLKVENTPTVDQSLMHDTEHDIVFDSTAVPVLNEPLNQPVDSPVHNHLMEDWQVDHLTLALNPSALRKIQECLESSTDSAA
jgi:hypothetical protein